MDKILKKLRMYVSYKCQPQDRKHPVYIQCEGVSQPYGKLYFNKKGF